MDAGPDELVAHIDRGRYAGGDAQGVVRIASLAIEAARLHDRARGARSLPRAVLRRPGPAGNRPLGRADLTIALRFPEEAGIEHANGGGTLEVRPGPAASIVRGRHGLPTGGGGPLSLVDGRIGFEGVALRFPADDGQPDGRPSNRSLGAGLRLRADVEGPDGGRPPFPEHRRRDRRAARTPGARWERRRQRPPRRRVGRSRRDRSVLDGGNPLGRGGVRKRARDRRHPRGRLHLPAATRLRRRGQPLAGRHRPLPRGRGPAHARPPGRGARVSAGAIPRLPGPRLPGRGARDRELSDGRVDEVPDGRRPHQRVPGGDLGAGDSARHRPRPLLARKVRARRRARRNRRRNGRRQRRAQHRRQDLRGALRRRRHRAPRDHRPEGLLRTRLREAVVPGRGLGKDRPAGPDGDREPRGGDALRPPRPGRLGAEAGGEDRLGRAHRIRRGAGAVDSHGAGESLRPRRPKISVALDARDLAALLLFTPLEVAPGRGGALGV